MSIIDLEFENSKTEYELFNKSVTGRRDKQQRELFNKFLLEKQDDSTSRPLRRLCASIWIRVISTIQPRCEQ